MSVGYSVGSSFSGWSAKTARTGKPTGTQGTIYLQCGSQFIFTIFRNANSKGEGKGEREKERETERVTGRKEEIREKEREGNGPRERERKIKITKEVIVECHSYRLLTWSF